MVWKIFSISSALFLLLGISDCGSNLGIKIYISWPEKGGLYRAQDEELISYDKSGGYFCTDETSMRKLIEAYKACEELTNP